jgi:hypothetical protein
MQKEAKKRQSGWLRLFLHSKMQSAALFLHGFAEQKRLRIGKMQIALPPRSDLPRRRLGKAGGFASFCIAKCSLQRDLRSRRLRFGQNAKRGKKEAKNPSSAESRAIRAFYFAFCRGKKRQSNAVAK